MNLVEIDYKSIKIDWCSSSEGVWLATGEMAQIFKLAKGTLDRLFSVYSRKYGYEQQAPRRRYANPKDLCNGNSSAV